MPASFDDALAGILGDQAEQVGSVLLCAGCADDHVHVVARLAATTSLAELVQRLKGGSAHDINHRRMPPLRLAWQAGHWAESLSPADLQPVLHYVRAQREHHDDSHPFEPWQLARPSTAQTHASAGSPPSGGLRRGFFK